MSEPDPSQIELNLVQEVHKKTTQSEGGGGERPRWQLGKNRIKLNPPPISICKSTYKTFLWVSLCFSSPALLLSAGWTIRFQSTPLHPLDSACPIIMKEHKRKCFIRQVRRRRRFYIYFILFISMGKEYHTGGGRRSSPTACFGNPHPETDRLSVQRDPSELSAYINEINFFDPPSSSSFVLP